MTVGLHDDGRKDDVTSPSNNNGRLDDTPSVTSPSHASADDDVSDDVMHGPVAGSDNNNEAADEAGDNDDDDDDGGGGGGDGGDGRVMVAEEDADDFINNLSSSPASALPTPPSSCELISLYDALHGRPQEFLQGEAKSTPLPFLSILLFPLSLLPVPSVPPSPLCPSFSAAKRPLKSSKGIRGSPISSPAKPRSQSQFR